MSLGQEKDTKTRGLWSKTTYDNWRKRAFDRACTAAKVDGATPYALRHSFASLLLHEGRSVVYVARDRRA